MKITFNLTQLAMVALISLSAHAKKLLVDIELAWKPTTETSEFQKHSFQNIASVDLYVENFTDGRKITPIRRIGENIEEAKDFLPVETRADVPAWITAHTAQVLKDVGLKIVNEKSQYILSGEIKEFFVSETDTYAGVLKIHFILKKGNQLVWQGDIVGKNTRSGRSYKYENYMETLSDSLIDACYQLLENDGFKSAFPTKTGKS